MALLSRIATMLKAKISSLLDRTEDPAESLDYSYEKQREMLRKVKQGIVEAVTSRRRLELQATKLRDQITQAELQARQAVQMGREDLARLTLQRKQTALLTLQGLDSQIADLEREQETLTVADGRLEAKVDAFRTRKEVIKAQYAAADAQVRIGEAFSGISEEMADVAMAVERAEEKTERLRARAGAIDELLAAGVLEDFSQRGGRVAQELAQLTAAQNVEDELARLKGELAAPEEPKQLDSGS